MLSEEASRDKNSKEMGEETTTEGLTKQYPLWLPTAHVGRAATPSDKAEDTAFLFEGKNTRV
jgi:hypothetical protein